MAEYEVVFDLIARSYPVPWVVVSICTFALVGLWGHVYASRRSRQVLPLIVALGFSAVTIVTLLGHRSDYDRLRRAIAAGETEIVEGPVEDFDPDSLGGSVPESFYVADTQFVVQGTRITPAFQHTVSLGGPNLTRMCARIVYVIDDRFRPPRRDIVWLGISEPPCTNSVAR